MGTIRMKDFGAEAGLFVSRRRGARSALLVLRDPVRSAGMDADTPADAAQDAPPDNPSDRAAWIARQLAADCFQFARPGGARR